MTALWSHTIDSRYCNGYGRCSRESVWIVSAVHDERRVISVPIVIMDETKKCRVVARRDNPDRWWIDLSVDCTGKTSPTVTIMQEGFAGCIRSGYVPADYFRKFIDDMKSVAAVIDELRASYARREKEKCRSRTCVHELDTDHYGFSVFEEPQWGGLYHEIVIALPSSDPLDNSDELYLTAVIGSGEMMQLSSDLDAIAEALASI